MARRQAHRFSRVLGTSGLVVAIAACSGSSSSRDREPGAAGSPAGGAGNQAAGAPSRPGTGGASESGGASSAGASGTATGGGSSTSGAGGSPEVGGSSAAGAGGTDPAETGGSSSGGVAGAAGVPASGGSAGSPAGGIGGGSAGSPAGGTGGGSAGAPAAGAGGGGDPLPLVPTCSAAATGSADVAQPELLLTLYDRWEEGWLGSPAIADLEGDGSREIIMPRADKMYAFNADGSIKWKLEGMPGRIWASAVVADFRGDSQLETVFASREQVFMVDAQGNALSGFPASWVDELRSIAAGDVDGDGQLDIVVATTRGGGGEDVVHALSASGTPLDGFPPLETGASGCEVDNLCDPAGAFDQNIGIGDLDGDGVQDIVVPQDNAYAGIYRGTGEVFDAHSSFPSAKVLGVRYLHDLALSQLGHPTSSLTDLQAHFTNTPPAIADLDQDGSYEAIMLASVQNAQQNERFHGVALWVVRSDASRLPAFEAPFHVPEYLAGLWDVGENIVGITCQVSVADIDAESAGLELIFPGFDGRIHAVGANAVELWSYPYTTLDSVMTGGVLVGDLSGDGVAEIVFNTYSINDGDSALFVLDAGGNLQRQIALPRRGAMAVPTLGDIDGDGQLEIVVSLKDAEDGVESALVYTVPGSSDNCLLWPTGRANLLRNGWVRSE